MRLEKVVPIVTQEDSAHGRPARLSIQQHHRLLSILDRLPKKKTYCPRGGSGSNDATAAASGAGSSSSAGELQYNQINIMDDDTNTDAGTGGRQRQQQRQQQATAATAAPGRSGREQCRGEEVPAEEHAKINAQLVVLAGPQPLHLRQIYIHMSVT